jgi:hypothetical protein
MASRREMNSFECKVCGATMETWNTAWVPSYRMIVGPNVDAVADSKPLLLPGQSMKKTKDG